jgi:glycosyltransferase involved in cell wall biosynthesis
MRYWFMIFALPLVLRLAGKADLIHTTTYNAALPAWVASLVRRKPAVITVHEVFGDQWNNPPGLHRWVGDGFRAYEWLILRLGFRHYVCDSEFSRGRLLRFVKVRPERVSLVYPAIDYDYWDPNKHRPRDVRAELGLPPDSFVYLYFGRPGISKGVEYLVEAVPHVRRELPQARLVMLLSRYPAKGNARARRRVRDLGLTDSVTVLDPVPRDELPGWLMGVDCVVVPSISEGFGYSAAEAACLGCTVVSTTGHSVEEVLGEAIVPVPPRQPQALAEAIVRVARERPRPGRPPRRYTLEDHIAGMKETYQKLRPH